ncbi:MAG: TRAP transporter small permease [Pseudomonadales bacterium]
MLQRFVRLLHWLENGLLLGLILGAVCLASTQIILRNSGADALLWADQALNILVLWIAMSGALVASRENNHIAIDLIQHYLPEKWLKVVTSLTQFATAAACGVAAWFGYHFVREEMEYGDMAFQQIPMWLCEAIIPFALFIISVRYLNYGIRSLFNAATNAPAS